MGRNGNIYDDIPNTPSKSLKKYLSKPWTQSEGGGRVDTAPVLMELAVLRHIDF